MKKIAIDNPCHENWNDFTPTEKGGFCSSCSVDVIDFSDKSPEEVKQILEQNAGKHMCGRFKKTQLDDLNEHYFVWEGQDTRTFQSKFMYALLLVFGMTLFSCNTEEELVLGEISYYEQVENGNEYNSEPNSETYNNGQNNHVKGKIKYDPNENTNCSVNENEFVKGDIAYTPDYIMGDTIIVDQNEIEPEDSLYDDIMVDGEMEWSPEFEEFLQDTAQNNVEIENYNPDTQTNPSISPIFTAELYPNPTNDQASVSVLVKEKAVFDIYLYEIDGKRTKSIHQGVLEPGRQIFKVDMTEYSSGTYMIVIIGDSQKETLKIQKAK